MAWLVIFATFIAMANRPTHSFVKSALCKSQVSSKLVTMTQGYEVHCSLVSIKTHHPETSFSFPLYPIPHLFFSFSMLTFSVSFMMFLFIDLCVLFVLPSTGFGPLCYWLLLTGKNVSHTPRSCLGTPTGPLLFVRCKHPCLHLWKITLFL